MTNESPLTVAGLLRERATDDHPALLFEDSAWSWREFVDESNARAQLLLDRLDPERPLHVGVMLENCPDYLFLIGAAAFAGAAVVGVNLTRRGEELAADIRASDCQLILTDTEHLPLLGGLDLGAATDRVITIDSAERIREIASCRGQDLVDRPAAHDPATTLLLLFTSGSTGSPKAVICSTGRLARTASRRHMGLGRDDVSYNAMPLFHGNALLACWSNPLFVGGTFALARRFSASRFVDDVIKFNATYFNYVGRSLAYILAQPERPEEHETRLRFAFGTEASRRDRDEFFRRFGVVPTEAYGASEGAVVLAPPGNDVPGVLGRAIDPKSVAVLNPETLEECPRAQFDANGSLLNADEAIGELANPIGARMFEGYYNNPEAMAERVRGDIFLTGDLAYRDSEDNFYFAGRSGERLRVDSENFSAIPVERILSRYTPASVASVYAVPDEQTGDQVMASFQLLPDEDFDPEEFASFLHAQPDLGTKWAPRYVRIVDEFPTTATQKINKPVLRRQMWLTSDRVYYRPTAEFDYRPLTEADKARIERNFLANQRINMLEIPVESATR